MGIGLVVVFSAGHVEAGQRFVQLGHVHARRCTLVHGCGFFTTHHGSAVLA